MHKYSSVIIGTGSYLPKAILTNDELAKKVDTNDEWITSRTGIKQRHIAAEGEFTSDLATEAAKKAIEAAKISAQEIDMIIVCTTTPDKTFPSVAVTVQAKLGIKNIPAFDLQAVCAGFVYGLSVADSFIKAGNAKTILLIGAETMSRVLNWQDRSTCVLFGDGAGAVVIKAEENPGTNSGIMFTQIHAAGEHEEILLTDGGVSLNQTAGTILMNGKEVYKHAVEKMGGVIKTLLEKANLNKDDLNWIIPHQANLRIIEAIAKRLEFPMEKMVVTLDSQANTSAATIPLALDYAVRNAMIKSGDLIAITALGAGLSWGGCILKWK